MRIGVDARLVYYRQAGISQYTVQLIQALARCEPQDDFTIVESIKAERPIIQRPRFTTRQVLTPSHHRLERWTLPLELSVLRLDVLHSPDFIAPPLRGTRSVITIHDLVFMLYPHLLTKASARYYGQIDLAVQRADAIIAVSEATKHDVVRLLGVPERKVTVIYEAASPHYRPMRSPEVTQRVRERFGLHGEFVLFVSTIEPRKNVPTLLQAFKRLLDDYRPDVKLVLAGEKGWLYESVFELVKTLQLQDRVVFLGRVSGDELLWLYNTAQVLVAPSIYEGFGLTPLEAMACGTPVVVSNVSSLPEVVGDAGLLVDPHSVEELAVAIWRALHDSDLREQMIARGLMQAARFSWDKAASETLALYHSVA